MTKLHNGLANLTDNVHTDVEMLQEGLTNLTEKVNGLQSKIHASASRTSMTASASASASGSGSDGGSSYEGGSSRMWEVPEVALGWILVEGLVAFFL